MSFGRKGSKAHNAGSARVARPQPKQQRKTKRSRDGRAVNAGQVMGTLAAKPKSNRLFGSGLFFMAAVIIGGGGWWADRSLNFYYDHGIPVIAEVTGSRTITPSGNTRRFRKLTLKALHPTFGPVELELAKPKNLAPLPNGSVASDTQVTLLLHPKDPKAGRIASAGGPTSPLVITTIMAAVFAAIAALNLISERRIIGSKSTRLQRD